MFAPIVDYSCYYRDFTDSWVYIAPGGEEPDGGFVFVWFSSKEKVEEWIESMKRKIKLGEYDV